MKNNLSLILGARLIKVSDIHENTGISKSTLTNLYYQKASNVKIGTLLKICDYLQVPLSELIEYDPLNEEKPS